MIFTKRSANLLPSFLPSCLLLSEKNSDAVLVNRLIGPKGSSASIISLISSAIAREILDSKPVPFDATTQSPYVSAPHRVQWHLHHTWATLCVRVFFSSDGSYIHEDKRCTWIPARVSRCETPRVSRFSNGECSVHLYRYTFRETPPQLPA